MAEVDAIVLAAGMSRRMGQRNKLLLDWGGVPLIRHVVETYMAALGPRVTVITGFEAGKVSDALAGLPVKTRFNPMFETGQQSSVLLGLRLESTARATLVGLGDQPLLTPRDLLDLMRAHKACDPSKIAFPVHGDRRGNPTILPARLRARILADNSQPGCKRFIRDNPDLVTRLPLTAPGFFTDIDTPACYAQHLEGVRKNEPHQTHKGLFLANARTG